MKFRIDEMDVEQFILEVKQRPEIWNVAQEEYHDRFKRYHAWIEISCVMCDGIKGNEKQMKSVAAALSKKWKNLKDAFYKSVKKRSKASNTVKPYVYAQQLSFLLQNMPKKYKTPRLSAGDDEDTLDGDDGEDGDEDSDIASVSNDSVPLSKSAAKKPKIEFETTWTNEEEPAPSINVSEVTDYNADRSFFESVLPSISDFNQDQKIEFRIEVLNVVKRMRTKRSEDQDA